VNVYDSVKKINMSANTKFDAKRRPVDLIKAVNEHEFCVTKCL